MEEKPTDWSNLNEEPSQGETQSPLAVVAVESTIENNYGVRESLMEKDEEYEAGSSALGKSSRDDT